MRLTPLVFAAALAACSNGATGKLSVSTKVAAGTAATAVTAGGGTSAALTIGSHVTLDRARILVRKVVLEPGEAEESGSGGGDGSTSVAGATAVAPTADKGGDSGDTESDASDEAAVRFGPFVVDVAGAELDGGLKLLFDEAVPAGTYEQLMFQVHKLTPGQAVSDTDFSPLGSSIILDLTVDEAPFTFRSDLTAVAEIEGPFTVDAGKDLAVTVTVDPSGWFTAADGSFLDPRVDANRQQIERNIRTSIRGFEDDDRDGKPDAH